MTHIENSEDLHATSSRNEGGEMSGKTNNIQIIITTTTTKIIIIIIINLLLWTILWFLHWSICNLVGILSTLHRLTLQFFLANRMNENYFERKTMVNNNT